VRTSTLKFVRHCRRDPLQQNTAAADTKGGAALFGQLSSLLLAYSSPNDNSSLPPARIDSLVAKCIGLCNIAIVEEDRKEYGTLQVFGTHMQSERTKAAQSACREQGLRAANFILKNRIEDRSPAVFVGDMNMGPPQEGLFSQHYSDKDDPEARSASYHSMVSGCSRDAAE
jgi:hypothetical protein